MRWTPIRSAILAGTALLMVAAAMVPTASAQTPTLDLTVDAPDGAIIPEAQIGQLSATVVYQYSNPLQVGGSLSSQSLTITFAVTCPSTILVVGPQTKIMSLSASESQTGGTVDADFQITITRQAPGLQSLQCTMQVSAPALVQTAVPAPGEATQTFSLLADYYSLVQAKLTTKVKQAGPQKNVPFSIELTNFGNARTLISFETAQRPTGKRWEILLPDQIILDSPNGGGEGKTTDTATLTVVTPYKNGWNNEQGAFQVNIKPSSADQAEKIGNPIQANVLVRVRGVYVPTVEPILMVGALLGSALLLRLRREE